MRGSPVNKIDDEVWKSIPGYEGYYSVSNLGRIKGDSRNVPHIKKGKLLKEKLMKPRINKKTGYICVNLSSFGKMKTYAVHSLVALAFLGERPLNKEVLHSDGDRLNANLDNLRYGTSKENSFDSIRHGTVAKGEFLPQAKLTEMQVKEIRNDKRYIKDIATDYSMSIASISRIKNNIDWRHVK